VPDGRLSIAYLTDPDLLQASGGSAPDAWERRLRRTRHTQARVSSGGYRLMENPHVAPAGTAILDRLSGANWVACGDAAASYDPLSSHGIATALATGHDAAEALHNSLAGNGATRARYEDRVRRSFEYYMRTKNEYYAQEQRWRDRPFWQRRNQG
jgi:flavin-dependent dehydrogenase